MNFILKCLPNDLSSLILKHNIDKIEEIRIRAGKPVILNMGNIEICLKYVINSTQIIGIVQSICNNSIYAYQNEIIEGFITVPGGNRVGIAGNVVVNNGQVANISHIYSLNIRISHQIENASDDVIRYILDTQNNSIHNSLIVSPPRMWKNNDNQRCG